MKCWEFNVEADSECISLKYSPHHLASQYGIELEQLQMAAYRGAIYPEYKIQNTSEYTEACYNQNTPGRERPASPFL